MAPKKRGSYNTTAKIRLTDQDRADHMVALLNAEIAQSPNLAAILNAVRSAPPGIQRLVIDKIIPAKRRRPGQPKRALPDDLILAGIEGEKADMARAGSKKVTDRDAVKSQLAKGFLRLGRLAETAFSPNTIAGKQEIARVIAAITRARKQQR